uniref:Uncharacterized protein n=1 Tax=Rhizophora mucronata TaxID=61149 RepID=A0A2P2JBQ8_RHIMU
MTADENADTTVDNGNKPHNGDERDHDGDQVPELAEVQNGALQRDAAVDVDALHRPSGAESVITIIITTSLLHKFRRLFFALVLV